MMLCSTGTFHCIIRLVCVYAFLKDCQSFFLLDLDLVTTCFWISNNDLLLFFHRYASMWRQMTLSLYESMNHLIRLKR